MTVAGGFVYFIWSGAGYLEYGVRCAGIGTAVAKLLGHLDADETRAAHHGAAGRYGGDPGADAVHIFQVAQGEVSRTVDACSRPAAGKGSGLAIEGRLAGPQHALSRDDPTRNGRFEGHGSEGENEMVVGVLVFLPTSDLLHGH